MDKTRQDALSRCRRTLEHEGFRVSSPSPRTENGAGDSDVLATNVGHRVCVHVVPTAHINDVRTRAHLLASAIEGETRVFVEWPVRWRMVSNLQRWGIRGVSVDTW